MLPIRKNCYCAEKKPDLGENLRAIVRDDSAGFELRGTRCHLPEK